MRMIFFAILIFWAASAAAQAEVRLPNILGDGMVLQCDKPVRVWGWAKAGEKVAVRFAGQAKSVTADAKGDWFVTLNPVEVR